MLFALLWSYFRIFYFSVMENRWYEISPYILRIQFFKIFKKQQI